MIRDGLRSTCRWLVERWVWRIVGIAYGRWVSCFVGYVRMLG
ncbi:hypothetical protein [Streptosporangium sp. NPDC006930]